MYNHDNLAFTCILTDIYDLYLKFSKICLGNHYHNAVFRNRKHLSTRQCAYKNEIYFKSPNVMRNIHHTLKVCIIIINSNRCAACTYVVLPPSLAVTSVSRGLRNCGGMSRVVLYWSCVSSTTESTWSGVKVKVWVTEVSVTDVSVWVRLCVSSSGMATK